MRARHDRSHRQCGVTAALAAAQDARTICEAERLSRRLTMGANEPVAPASLLQVAGTGRIVREKSLELWQRLWEPKIATLANVHEHGRTLPLVAVGDNRIGKDRSRWWGPVPRHGLRAAVKNGSTTSEPRRRCACMHHGSGHCDPPDTRLRCESLVPRQRAPLGRVIPTQRACRRRGQARWQAREWGPSSQVVEQRNWDEESKECREIALDFEGLIQGVAWKR